VADLLLVAIYLFTATIFQILETHKVGLLRDLTVLQTAETTQFLEQQLHLEVAEDQDLLILLHVLVMVVLAAEQVQQAHNLEEKKLREILEAYLDLVQMVEVLLVVE
jgi:ABC-type iron transport system FetAB permease component